MRVRQLAGGVAAIMLAAIAGCNAFAPSSISNVTKSRDEKKILSLAKADPFPSPADVGLQQPTAVP